MRLAFMPGPDAEYFSHPAVAGAPSTRVPRRFGRRRRYGSSLLRSFLLECIAPSLPLRRHHFYQLIAYWHTNVQQEFAYGFLPS